MIDLGNRYILDDGTVICRTQALVDLLYSGRSIDGVLVEPSDEKDLYDRADRMLDTNYGVLESADGPAYGDQDWFSHWLTPSPYDSIDVESLCMDRCETQAQRDRVRQEMVLFRQRNMEPVLKHLVFLVDHWRERNVLWGVGRGSSVSSFVLFLIGINRINPLDFDLDIREFLK